MKRFNALVNYDFCIKLYQENLNFSAMCVMVLKEELQNG